MKADPQRNKKKKKSKTWIWPVQIFFITLLLSGTMSAASDALMTDASFLAAIGVLAVLIALGVIFDMLGVAITSANEAPFVAMASKRVRGAKQSLRILKNTEKYASFCNDVIGDICGVVSGAAGAAIAALATAQYGFLSAAVWSILSSAAVSALTVSLKALGKTVALNNSKDFVLFCGKILSFFDWKNRG